MIKKWYIDLKNKNELSEISVVQAGEPFQTGSST